VGYFSRLKTLQDVKNGLKTAGFHDASSSRFQGSNISKSSRLKTSVGYWSRLKISRRFKLKISSCKDLKSSRLKTLVGYCSRISSRPSRRVKNRQRRRSRLKIPRLQEHQVLKLQNFKTLKTPQELAQDRGHSRLVRISRLQVQDFQGFKLQVQDSQIFETQDTSRIGSRPP
jgi:hypothetical protein